MFSGVQHDGPQQLFAPGFVASMTAEAAKFSAPDPGIHSRMNAALSGLGVIRMFSKPATRINACRVSTDADPDTHPVNAAISCSSFSGNSWSFTTSEIARRPPGLSTRNASRNTLALSGERLITQIRENHVDRCIRHRQTFNLSQPELDIFRVDSLCVRTRLRDHVGCHVDADDSSRDTDLTRGKKTIETTSAAQVEHGFAWPERRNRLWIAAAKTHVGADWNRSNISSSTRARGWRFGMGRSSLSRSLHRCFAQPCRTSHEPSHEPCLVIVV